MSFYVFLEADKIMLYIIDVLYALVGTNRDSYTSTIGVYISNGITIPT